MAKKPSDNEDVAAKKKKKLNQRSPVLDRLEDLRRATDLSQSDVAEKAGLGRTTYTKALQRGSSPSVDNAKALADVFGVSLDELVGAYPLSLEQSFVGLQQWAHATPAISKVLTLHGQRVTIGDLLRYKASPSSQGEFNAEEVWSHMQALKHGSVRGGKDVTPAEEATVPTMPRGKGKKR